MFIGAHEHEPPRPRGHCPLPRVCGARALAVTAPSPVCVEHAPSRSPPPSPCAWRWVYGVTVHLTAVLARSVPVGRGPTPLSSQVFPLIFICAGVGTGIGHALKVKSNILDTQKSLHLVFQDVKDIISIFPLGNSPRELPPSSFIPWTVAHQAPLSM